jgi:inner membrane protein
MDNLCHTLAGAAFGEAGLKQRTRYGNATLMIASNLPDLDVLVFFTDTSGFAFRRGWTHGILAQAVLPVVFAATVWAIARMLAPRTGARLGRPVNFGWLLILSYVGVLSHVFLDYLNNYGVRLLAPLDWTWSYGDAVFIVDLFLWVGFGLGIWLSRRSGRVVFARGALVSAACYIAVTLVAARASRGIVADAWRDLRGTAPVELMVGPVPFTPFTRVAIVDAGDRYDVGTFRWWPASVTFEPTSVPKNDRDPAVAAARAQSPLVREFLVWSRFPAWTITPTSEGSQVTVFDLRFMSRAVSGATFQATTVVRKD